MATYEALFRNGMRATFEADAMTIEEGVIVLMRETNGRGTAVAAIGSDELLFITVENAEEDDDD